MEDTAHSLPLHDWADLVSDLKSKSNNPNTEKKLTSSESVNQLADLAESKVPPASSTLVTPPFKPSNNSLEDTAHSLPKLDWADLAASIQTRPLEVAVEKAKPVAPAFVNTSTPSPLNGQSSPVSQLAAPSETPANHQDNGASSPVATTAAANSASQAGPDPALVEAVVQRVLEKMRPQVVDIITKEFLRPVVQALVHREITKR
jgi:hypothetical protein